MRRLTLETLPEAFWAKVDKTEACWLWTGSRVAGGYGMFWLRNGLVSGAPLGSEPHGGRMHPATRVAWCLTHGDWPRQGYDMCHACDNPPCVNPAHLWEGTEAENLRDAVQKGRISRTGAPGGERHPDHKLTDAQVREVLDMLAQGLPQASIGERFGVSQSTISAYRRGIRRKDITAA